ncbi:alpha/beta fold hydrolase [Blastococcus sp. SYSU D00695]
MTVRAEDPLGRWAVEVVDGSTHYLRPRGPSPDAGAPGGAPLLLLNGCALPAACWLPVLNALPDRDVLAMDRPGFAGTPWDGRLPDLPSEVAAVRRVISGAGRGRPVVVVAHSMAAFRAEALARLHPELVAGLVLVDPSIESLRERGRADLLVRETVLRGLAAVSGWGPVRSLAARAADRGFRQQTASSGLDGRVLSEPYRSPDTLRSIAAEFLSYRRQAAQLSALRRRTGPLAPPTSVLLAPPLPDGRHRAVLRASVAPQRCVELPDSGHLVMLDRPDAVVAAIGALPR